MNSLMAAIFLSLAIMSLGATGMTLWGLGMIAAGRTSRDPRQPVT